MTAKEQVQVMNPLGLHLRSSMELAQVASRIESRLEVTYSGRRVDLRSILGILSLGAHQGDVLEFKAEGADAREALDAILGLFLRRLNHLLNP